MEEGGTAEGGTRVGLSGENVGERRETWQMGPTLHVQCQPAVGYKRGVGGHWPNPGWGAARAIKATANQQR